MELGSQSVNASTLDGNPWLKVRFASWLTPGGAIPNPGICLVKSWFVLKTIPMDFYEVMSGFGAIDTPTDRSQEARAAFLRGLNVPLVLRLRPLSPLHVVQEGTSRPRHDCDK